MSLTTFTLFVSLLAIPAALMYALLVQWPTLSQTRYHERIWTIRDQAMDDVLAGRLQWSPGAQNLIKHLESLAENSHRANLLHALVIRAMNVIPMSDLEHFEDIMLGPGTPLEDRTRLLHYVHQAQRATLIQLTFGSVSGIFGASILGWQVIFRTAFKDRFIRKADPVAQVEMLKVVKSHEPRVA